MKALFVFLAILATSVAAQTVAARGPTAAFSQFPRPWTYGDQPAVMGYAVRTRTHRYIEWRRFGTHEVVARVRKLAALLH